MTRAWLAAVVSLCVLGLVACPAQPTPCTPADLEMIAHGAECRARAKACGADELCRSAVFAECDAWGETRCGLGEAGAHE